MPSYITKYLAAGWWATIADVDCSGSSKNPVVNFTATFFFRMQQAKQLGLIFQVRTCGIAK